MKYLTNAISIIACGAGGALAGWAIVSALGWTGVGAALAMVGIAMVVAAALFGLGVAIGRALGIIRT